MQGWEWFLLMGQRRVRELEQSLCDGPQEEGRRWPRALTLCLCVRDITAGFRMHFGNFRIKAHQPHGLFLQTILNSSASSMHPQKHQNAPEQQHMGLL